MNYLSWVRLVPIWVYVLLFAICVICAQQWRVHHYRAQVAALQGVANTLHDANQTNLATIDALKATVDDWKHKCAANEPEARQQAQLSVEADAKQQAGAHKTIQALQATYDREPTVKAWADTRVPAAVADRLRQAGNPN